MDETRHVSLMCSRERVSSSFFTVFYYINKEVLRNSYVHKNKVRVELDKEGLVLDVHTSTSFGINALRQRYVYLYTHN